MKLDILVTMTSSSLKNTSQKNINNQLKKFKMKGRFFLTKFYDLNRADSQIRFEREVSFYKFLSENNISNVPELILIRPDVKEIDISFFEGQTRDKGTINDLKNFSLFTAELNYKNNTNKLIQKLPNAAESFFSQSELAQCIEHRLNAVEMSQIEPVFSEERFILLKNHIEHINQKYQFDIGGHVVNPSDLGLHNYLVNDNSHCFVDFEYSGRDCAAKLLYDFALHPKNKFQGLNVKEIFEILACGLGLTISFDKRLAQIFCFWWILRLLISLTSKQALKRMQFRDFNFKQKECYFRERINNLKYFDRCFDDFG